MRRIVLIGLIGVNVVLAGAVLGSVFQIPHAMAQAMGLSGNFLMVAGGVLGTNADVVYVVDLSDRELVALQYNRSSGAVEIKGRRNLDRDLAQPPPTAAKKTRSGRGKRRAY